MIEKVAYKEEDGSIEIDNSELLRTRADISDEPGEQKLHSDKLGGLEGGSEEYKLKSDLKRTGWKEAKKATDVKHQCPICGTRYWGRPNKTYCGTPCKEVAKKRRSRKRKRDIRDFKPNRGKAGEVYFMYDNGGKEGITFVPAFHADTRQRAKNYLVLTYPVDKVDEYYEQVKEVIRK
ncbi:unnamed protein product [marine sediment metagenome]|uniref:Uncharacterized protein n=1 Tax=marine sediment metagenome TaxID=412755 RepID=X1F6M3_9ZZZZ